MTPIGLGQVLALVAILALITKPLGAYMANVFEGKRTFVSRLVLPVERLIYRITRIHPENDQLWTTYAGSCLAFSLVNFLAFYAILRWQRYLPFNPQGFGSPVAMSGSTPMTPDLAFNTAVSFMTNTS